MLTEFSGVVNLVRRPATQAENASAGHHPENALLGMQYLAARFDLLCLETNWIALPRIMLATWLNQLRGKKCAPRSVSGLVALKKETFHMSSRSRSSYPKTLPRSTMLA
jgi:hypothetical protein